VTWLARDDNNADPPPIRFWQLDCAKPFGAKIAVTFV
jgi:hypothetical protein